MNQLTMSPMRLWIPSYSRPPLEELITVTADIFVDGREMPELFVLSSWFPALTATQLVPLFTCGCSQFGCGGYYVAIEHAPDA